MAELQGKKYQPKGRWSMKKTCVSVLVGLIICILPYSAGAQEIQGQTINAETIQQLQQLPSDIKTSKDITQLPPDIQARIRQEQAKQQPEKTSTTPDTQTLQQEDIQDERNKLTDDSPGEASSESDEADQEKEDDPNGKAEVLDDSGRTSIIEEQYRKGYDSLLSRNLTQFGYDVFSSASIQETSLAVPDPDYVLGTGDQLTIRVWGSGIDTEFTTTVDREGTINVPKIGILQVAGIRYGDIESVIKKETEKYVHGINLSVILTRLRSIEIFVFGAVRNPGLQMVPAFSTIFDGLLRAGGVKKSGSLRQIRLNRAGKTVKNFDLYDLILKGDSGSNEILANKDIIFVPGIGKTAAIAGGILNEGIFELNREKNIQDLVKISGGVLPQASGSRIYLRRFEDNRNFIIHDIDADSMAEWARYPIKNGDLVEVTFSSSQLPNVVRVQGHVWAEDVFRYEPGMRLSDVLSSPAQLMPDAVTDFALIHRYDLETTRVIPMQFPLSQVFSGQFDASLHPYDRIQVLSRAGLGITETFAVTGAVWKPGEFDYKAGLKLVDALALAGGLRSEAREDRIEIARKIKTENRFETQYIQVSLVENPDFRLQAQDRIQVPRLEDYYVSLEGHVWYPEKIRYHSGMTLADVLISQKLPKPEDLLKPDVLMDFGLIERYDPETTRTTSYRFPLADVFSGEYDAPLQPFDVVKVLSRKGMGIEEKFRINGAVWKPGEFDFQPGLRLKDALALAGGVKFGARTEKIEVARQFVREDQVFTEYLLLDSETDKDFLLQSSDTILVPLVKNASRIAQVTITGEVAYPGTYAIREGERISELIRRAGGFSEYAYFYGAKYTSEEARVIQQKSIDQMVQKLRMSLVQATATESQTAVSTEALETAEFAKKTTEDLLRQLSSIRAEGRVSIKLADLASFENSLFDFRIKDSDALHIPPKPAFVSVVGSVYSPGSFLYEPNKTLAYYLAKSGGASKTADKKYMYLLKANGEILSMHNQSAFFSNFDKTVLMPGDTIVVPENLERVPYMRLVKDIADIAFKIATTAGVAFAIAL
jgi:protein involved in polysaccharide export with SLBB domain